MHDEQPDWLVPCIERCRSARATEKDWRQLLSFLQPVILQSARTQAYRSWLLYGTWENPHVLAADALYIVYTKLHSIQQPDKIVHWIRVVIKRHLMVRYRKLRLEHLTALLPDAPYYGRNSAHSIVTQLKFELAKLPWDQRRTIFVWYWLGLSPDECAKLLGVSRVTIYNNLRRAHKSLRQSLQDAGFTGSE